MSRRKVCVVVASRANYGRIKSAMHAIKDHPDLELQLIVTASALLHRFGSVIDIIRSDGFEPAANVYMVVEGETPQTMAKSTGLAIIELAGVFDMLKPDVVLSVADRYETLATAVAASYMNISVAHTQGGEETGSIDESVRHAITKLSHIHFPANKRAHDILLKMGEDPKTVHLTGCPALDLVMGLDLTLSSDVMSTRGTGVNIDPASQFLTVIMHPVTTEYGDTAEHISAVLEAVRRIKHPTLWLWPNIDAGSDIISKHLRSFRENEKPDYLHLVRNFPPEDYLRVMNASGCVVGNTSSSLREGAFLGVPAVNVGNRQANRERGENIIDVSNDADEIEEAILKQMAHGKYKPSDIYGDGTAGQKIADILARVPLGSVQKKLHY